MATKTKTPSKAASLRIEGEMTIYRAAELKESLLAPLRDAGSLEVTLEVDLSAVTEIDSAGVQLLLLAKEAARTPPCELHLVKPSPAVLDVFELLNLAGHFGDAPAMPDRAA